MSKTTALALATLLLCVAANSALGNWSWFWTLPIPLQRYDLPNEPHVDHATDSENVYFHLTNNNGSHAVAMAEYDSSGVKRVWTDVLAERLVPDWTPSGNLRAFEYSDIQPDWRHWTPAGSMWPFIPHHPEHDDMKAVGGHVANNALYKTFTWCAPQGFDYPDDHPQGLGSNGRPDYPDLTYQDYNFWDPSHSFHVDVDSLANDSGVAVVLFQNPSESLGRGCAVYVTWEQDGSYYVLGKQTTTNGGTNWHPLMTPDPIQTSSQPCFSHPSLATNDYGPDVYLAYESLSTGNERHILFRRSTDFGDTWPHDLVRHIASSGTEPCIAAVGQFVFVSWRTQEANSRVRYRVSTDGGSYWSDPADVPFEAHPGWRYDRPNVAAAQCPDDYPGFLIVARLGLPYAVNRDAWTTRGWFLRFHKDSPNYNIKQQLMPLSAELHYGVEDEPLNPSIAALKRTDYSGHFPINTTPTICYLSLSRDVCDGRDREAPRGVYSNRLDTPGFTDVKKAVLVR